MQSFKQYLKEENHNPNGFPTTPFIEITTSYCLTDFTDNYFDEFFDPNSTQSTREQQDEFIGHVTQELYNKLNTHNIDVYFDSDDTICVSFDIDEHNATSTFIISKCNEYAPAIKEVLNLKMGLKPEDAFLVFRTELPETFKTDWSRISFFLNHSHPITLKNIHHKIPNCKFLVLNEAVNKIKGNILGILKLKNLLFLNVWPATEQQPLWYKILGKYYNGDKNVLACQEELMDNGLKEYAKL